MASCQTVNYLEPRSAALTTSWLRTRLIPEVLDATDAAAIFWWGCVTVPVSVASPFSTVTVTLQGVRIPRMASLLITDCVNLMSALLWAIVRSHLAKEQYVTCSPYRNEK